MHDFLERYRFPPIAEGSAAAILAPVPVSAPDARWQAHLSDAERQRAQACQNPVARAEFCYARLLLRLWLAPICQLAPREIPIYIGAYGRPALAPPYQNLQLNLSHAAGTVLLGVAMGGVIGVDLEMHAQCDHPLELARMVMSDREVKLLARLQGPARTRAFLRLWTRREAVLKYHGCGFAGNSRAFSVLGHGNDPVLHEGCAMGQLWCIASAPGMRVAAPTILSITQC